LPCPLFLFFSSSAFSEFFTLSLHDALPILLLVWIAFPTLHKQYVKHEIDHFFRVFDSDILIIQNQTLEGRDLWLHLKKDHYIVKERNKNSIHTRHYPKHLGPQSFARKQIEYNNKGRV